MLGDPLPRQVAGATETDWRTKAKAIYLERGVANLRFSGKHRIEGAVNTGDEAGAIEGVGAAVSHHDRKSLEYWLS